MQLQWRYNGRHRVSNHRPHDCLFIQAQIKGSIKAPRRWPLWGEFTGDRWIPPQKAINAENISIWWRHRGKTSSRRHLLDFEQMNDELDAGSGPQPQKIRYALQWRHNGRDSVSNHQPHYYLLNRLFRRRSRKTALLRVTGLCVGNSPVTGEFPAQMASNAENVSIWWRHHGTLFNFSHVAFPVVWYLDSRLMKQQCDACMGTSYRKLARC